MRINLNNFLLTSCSGLAIALTSALNAHALPTGGQIESGSATITQTDASNLVIDQHTDRAVINWTNFDILRGETTRFNQLSSSSIALNRVTDGNPTQILGNLSANGRVFIVNPSGVVFGAGSRVDVAGLVATTANITTHDFLAGHMRFNHAGRPDARIINQGNITARDGGLVALVAPYVENSGVIAARMGTVAIGAAKTVTLDLYGDNLYGFKLGEQADAQGSGVKNTGEISAQGGRVLISAKTAQDVVNQAINLEGVVDATSMREVNGEIIIDGNEGSVRVAGMLNASGKNAGEKGGRVQVTGKKITLAGATVDAGGYNGGGEVRIGGDKKGGGTIARADYVDVDSASLIDVSATDNGDGGSSVVWSDIATNFYGRLRGRGGENGGNGGFAEVSSKNDLTYNGAANLGATNGRGGQMLLDPLNIIIDALTAASIVGDLNTGTDVIVETNLVGPDAGDITIDAAMNWTGIGSLIFNAMNDIIMNASIGNTSATGGNVTFNAGNDGAGNLAINNGANIDIAGALTLNAAGGTVSIADADLSATDITVNATLNYIGTAGATRQIRAGAGTFTLAAGAPMDIGDRHVNIVADNITIESTINGAGGSVYVRGHDVNRSMGLAGGVGDLQIDVSELDLLSAVSNQIYGNANGVGFTSGDIDVAARNWAGHGLTIVTTGKLTISGAQNYSDMNYLSLGASDYDIAANLTSVFGTSNSLLFNFTGALMTMGGAADIINTAELNLIDDGFTSIQFGAGAISNVTVNAYNNWRDPVQFTNAGTLTVSGAQAAEAASNASIRFANGGLTTINQNVDFSGSSTGGISFAGSLLHTVNLGANLISGVDGLTIDRAVNLLGAAGTTRVLNANTGTLSINNNAVTTFGSINAGAANLTLIADNIDMTGGINGTATTSVRIREFTAGRTMGLAGGAGDLNLSNAELNLIAPNLFAVVYGATSSTGAIDVGARNWQSMNWAHIFYANAPITVSGAQTFAPGTNVFYGAQNYNINATIAGNAILGFENRNAAGLTVGGAAGTTMLDSAELDRLQDGFSVINIAGGLANNITMEAYNNWRDPVYLGGAGVNTIAGVQSAVAGSNASFEVGHGTTNINANLDFSGSTTGRILLTRFASNVVNLGANLISGVGGITINRPVNLVGAMGTTRTLDAGAGNVTINNNGTTLLGAINGTGQNLRADSAGFTLNGATINTAGGNIDIYNTGVFFSSLANSLNTGGAGRIYVQQNVGGLIQNAVDAVGTQGTGGATVQAGAGVFEEHVNVGKNLTLRGTLDGLGNRLTTITSPTILAVNFTDNADNRGIIYGHDANITIRDFIIDGLSRGNGNSRFTGVLLQNARGSVTNNFITNIQDNPFSGNQGGTGIYVSNMDSVARDLTVSNNTINNFQKNGITVKGNGLFATITGNIVTGIGATAIIGQNGIQIGGSIGGPLVAGVNANGVISGNTISGIGFITTPGITSGVLVTSAGNNVSVTGNTINGTGFDNAVLVDSTNGALVSENVIGNIAGSLHGVRVTASNNTTVNLNVISNSANSGILLDAVGVTTVTNNTTNANGVGISVFNTDNFTLGGSNVISNNTVGVLFNNSDNGTYELDALDIAAGGTGLRLENGSGNFIVRDVVFNGGETAVLIDGAASNMQFDSNGSFFNGNNFYFVLQNGAMAGETLIATQQTFDGTRAISFNLAQRNAAEAKTIDVEDGFGVGNVFYRDFSFGVLDQLAQQKSNVFGGDVFSYNGFTLENNIQLNNYQFDITSLDLSLLNTAAGGRGASPADLNNLTTAGNDENASAAQLNDLETAAGGDENGCGNSYLGSGAEFGFRNESCLKSDAI